MTKADKEIEQYLRKELSDLLPDSYILGEETAPHQSEAPFDHEYVWSIDPIDGTANYANGFPLFGISVGLLQKTARGHKPLFGAVYFPALGELIYNNQEKVNIEKRVGNTIVHTTTTDKPKAIKRNTPLMFSSKFFSNYDFDQKTSSKEIRMTGTTVGNLACTALGRSGGTMISCYLWDFAGTLPIAEKLGVHMRDYKTGAIKDVFTNEDFQFGASDKNWKLTKPYIVSTEENYAIIKASITPKKA